MAEGGGLPRQSYPKLTMEGYLDFLHSHRKLDLTVSHLNQIIDMHGFKKVHGARKSDLEEAVKTMELIDPARSTLGDAGVSSDAFVTLDDLIKDINELQWQECCITSLQTINAADHDDQQHQISNIESTALTVVSAASFAKPRRPRKKLKKLADNGAGAGDHLSSISFNSGTSHRASSSPLVMKVVPKKQRINNLKHINLNPIGNHGDGDLDCSSAVPVTDLQPPSSSSSAFPPLGSY